MESKKQSPTNQSPIDGTPRLILPQKYYFDNMPSQMKHSIASKMSMLDTPTRLNGGQPLSSIYEKKPKSSKKTTSTVKLPKLV